MSDNVLCLNISKKETTKFPRVPTTCMLLFIITITVVCKPKTICIQFLRRNLARSVVMINNMLATGSQSTDMELLGDILTPAQALERVEC